MNSQISDCLALADKLCPLVEEETARLSAGETATTLGDLATEKTRLTDEFVLAHEGLKRGGRAALMAAPEGQRQALATALAALNHAIAENGRALARRKSLTEGLVHAVLAEARRQSGREVTTYGANGGTRGARGAAAVAVNAAV